MELPGSSIYFHSCPSSEAFQPNTTATTLHSSNDVHTLLAMSAANPDHFDSLSSHNRPFTSGPSLAPFQPDPRATLSWQPYRVDTSTAVSGTNPNQLESLSFSDHQFASRPVSAPFQSDVMASDMYSSNNVRTSWVTTSANPKGSISKQDWNKHRALITKLYAKQTLPEVMKFMETKCHFRAT